MTPLEEALNERIKYLEHQNAVLLVLGGLNLFLNVATIVIAVLVSTG